MLKCRSEKNFWEVKLSSASSYALHPRIKPHNLSFFTYLYMKRILRAKPYFDQECKAVSLRP